MLLNVWGSEEELSVCASVSLGVLDGDLVKSLADSASALVGSEDSLTGGSDLSGGLDEFFSEV